METISMVEFPKITTVCWTFVAFNCYLNSGVSDKMTLEVLVG